MMSDIIKTGGTGLISHIVNNSIVLPKPFERDIFLFDTVIAGTSYIKDIDIIAGSINEDDRLTFLRESANKHDDMAIMIKTADGAKLGYVPKADNAIFARLMDAGKLLFGRIASMEKKRKWYKISIKVYLHE